MDQADRKFREARATEMAPALADDGVVGVATSFVDNAGISRVKTVPVARFPELAAWGAGFSTAFDYFRADDWVAAPASGAGPVGDQRIIPDLDRVVVLAGQSGWAWAPGERYQQDGTPHPHDSRLLLRRIVDDWAEQGVTFRAGIEIEWVISAGDGDTFTPAASGPAYGLGRLTAVSEYCRDLLEVLAAQGVSVAQLHPEYAPGQFELSMAAESPVAAADTSVLVRATVRAIGIRHGFRTSFSPKVDSAGVGNGGHLHVSPWRDGVNLMSGGDGPYGVTPEGESFAGGVLAHLPALLALGAPSVVSYLRLVPQHWAGAYACWGLENREAALRLVTGSAGSQGWAANLEIKCVDLHANPYLLLAGVLAAGADATPLPDPVEVDPAALGEAELARRGVARLPTSLRESLEAFLADRVLGEAFGAPLVESIAAVRESELEALGAASPDEVADASRWAH
ncbi:MAG TPA: glutamine synthetase family protein [Lapillicoccus sp.]|nr:glutamine synthetase family protein [Lapillicoccus sp.]